MSRRLWLLVAIGLASLTATASAIDWPQWRGPSRDGVSSESGLLKEWPKDGPPLVWHAKEIGDGYSTPAVVGDRIYLISNKGMDNEFVQALDAKDGKQIWSKPIGKVGPNRGPQYPGSRGTPTVDGDVLYAIGSDGDLVCLEAANGTIRWQKNLRAEFGGKPGAWAYSESPLIDGDVLVCTPGGKEATLVALDKKSGDVVWKSAIPEGDEAAYSSVIVVNVGDRKQYVQFVQKGLVGVDAETGKFLWRYAETAKGSPANIPTAVARDGYVYSAAGRSGGGLIKLNVGPDSVDAEQVYFKKQLPTSIGGSVEVDGHLYGTSSQGLQCVDFKTGDVKWQERGIGPSSICFADGMLYLHGENGDVALVEAAPAEYREKGRMTPPEAPARGKSKAWAYPVVANGRLYIRDLSSLWCYDVKQ